MPNFTCFVSKCCTANTSDFLDTLLTFEFALYHLLTSTSLHHYDVVIHVISEVLMLLFYINYFKKPSSLQRLDDQSLKDFFMLR